MIVTGSNWVILIESNETVVGLSVVNNGNGTQTVTVTWGFTYDDLALVRIGYNDGTWHETAVAHSSPQSITIPVGSYTYKISFTHGLITTTFTPLPVTGLTWTPWVCSRSGSLEVNTGSIETSGGGTGVWKRQKPTFHEWNLTMSGVTALNVFGSLDFRDLQEKQFAQERLHLRVERTDEEGSVYANEGYGYIFNSKDTGSFDGVATFDLTIGGDDELTQTGSNVS